MWKVHVSEDIPWSPFLNNSEESSSMLDTTFITHLPVNFFNNFVDWAYWLLHFWLSSTMDLCWELMFLLFADYGIAKWLCRCVYWGNGKDDSVEAQFEYSYFAGLNWYLYLSGFVHLLSFNVLCPSQVIIKKRPSRNINVQNFWLYVFGIIFNSIAIFTQDFDAVIEKYGGRTFSVSLCSYTQLTKESALHAGVSFMDTL